MVYSINLEPLIDAHFETTDEGEAMFIYDVMKSIENGSPWPRRLYESGDAEKCMGPTACKALGVVLKNIKDVKEPWFPDDLPSESSEEDEIVKDGVIDLVSSEEEVKEKVVFKTPMKPPLSVSKNPNSKRITVCALPCMDSEMNYYSYSRKGKAKVGSFKESGGSGTKSFLKSGSKRRGIVIGGTDLNKNSCKGGLTTVPLLSLFTCVFLHVNFCCCWFVFFYFNAYVYSACVGDLESVGDVECFCW
ncbi:hypothetical protein BVRB_5g109030 [Beta vulgaris subsp. vulgaris]|nr:hypothetical protein BVRB_5g109030 [Beta vulgaris subsp. vulgaris]